MFQHIEAHDDVIAVERELLRLGANIDAHLIAFEHASGEGHAVLPDFKIGYLMAGQGESGGVESQPVPISQDMRRAGVISVEEVEYPLAHLLLGRITIPSKGFIHEGVGSGIKPRQLVAEYE